MKRTLKEELDRYNSINLYGHNLFLEQELPPLPPDPATAPPAPGTESLPADPAAAPPAPEMPTDAAPTDELAPDTMEAPVDSTEEIDVTDLYNMTKSIKNQLDSQTNTDQENVTNQITSVFEKLNSIEQQLSQMDQLFNKIDQVGEKIELSKEPTPVEKLEMRSLDSYPFSQNPQQFFDIKQNEMRQSGKNEYVLTKQEVEDYSQNVIKNSFNPYKDETQF